MTCPYCPFMIDVMYKDKELDTSALYFNQILEEIPKFILRCKEEVKLFIKAFEEKKPNLLKLY